MLIITSIITGYVIISTFDSLVGVPIGITSSAIGLKTCAITAVIKKFKSIIKKKRKKHDKIVLLAKSILNNMEVLISKAFSIELKIGHNEYVLIIIWRKNFMI